MSGEAVTVTVGFFGKLPAHGDFVRRGLPSSVTKSLDDWLQAEFARSSDPAAAIATLKPVRFASSSVVDRELALGTMIESVDRVGRAYVLMALRLSPHPSRVLPDPMPPAWDDWCGRAEALLIAARNSDWTADATQAALETAARAAVVALTPPAPYVVPQVLAPMTVSWRSSVDSGARRVDRTDGLPRDDAFDRFLAPVED